ncbi:MAG: hypothetical protein ACE361_19420 [Aureliella sp.]
MEIKIGIADAHKLKNAGIDLLDAESLGSFVDDRFAQVQAMEILTGEAARLANLTKQKQGQPGGGPGGLLAALSPNPNLQRQMQAATRAMQNMQQATIPGVNAPAIPAAAAPQMPLAMNDGGMLKAIAENTSSTVQELRLSRRHGGGGGFRR